MDKVIEKKAKALALEHLNENRKRHKTMKPLKTVPKQWWSMYKQEWIDKVEPEVDPEFLDHECKTEVGEVCDFCGRKRIE